MNGLEDRLRRGLDAPFEVEPAEALVSRVSAGARRRRQRRTAAIAVGAAATVAVIALGSVLLGRPNPSPEPHPPPPAPSLPVGAAVGTIDVAVPDADHVFKLTVNEGCVACSTVWLRGDDGSWERLHDFSGTAAYGGKVDPLFGPIEYVEFAPDARNGWAWGDTLFSTHDGGRTWSQVETGPGAAPNEYGHWVHLTPEQAWGLRRPPRGLPEPELWWTPIGADDWSTTLLPRAWSVVDIDTVGDRVVVLAASEGAGRLTLLSRNEVDDWTGLDLPCPGENQPYAAATEVFALCPAAGGATIHRSADLASWQVFGHSDLTAVTAVLPLSDEHILLVGEPNDLLVTPSGAQPVDVGLRPGEEIFQGTFGTAGATTYAVTSEHRILVSTDAGENWSALD